MFVQNFIRLNAAVCELSCPQSTILKTILLFMRKSRYCFQRVLAIAMSVRLSVHHTGGSVKNGAS